MIHLPPPVWQRAVLPLHLWASARLLLRLLVGSACSVFWVVQAGSPAPKPAFGTAPNILIILTDDQGYGELSCHGNPVLKTPHLDALHSQSVRFTDFHVSPTCAPTRSALLTGRHEFRSGVTHTIFERERLSLSAVTLAEVLQRGGYRTGIFGKWHLGDEPEYQPGRRGFDEVFIHGGGGIGQTYPGSCGDVPRNTYHQPVVRHNGRFETTRGYCTDVFFDAAWGWIHTNQIQQKPFFAFITPNAPHDPFITPGPEWQRPFREKGLGELTTAYYAMIANIDANVGRLLARLHTTGLETNTLVIFMTDNGHGMGSLYNAGMRGAKGGPYQGGTRVPSFWRWKGVLPEGIDCHRLTAHLDLFPTLLDITGCIRPQFVGTKPWPQLEGRSLVPLLRSPGAAWDDRQLFIHVGRWESGQSAEARWKQTAVRTARYRMINGAELYDIQQDPGETRDLSGTHPEVMRELRRAHEAWWNSILPSALENEEILGPPINPFKQDYWEAFPEPRDPDLLWRMDPALKFNPGRPRI